jgi:CheY-like chemotaxis protein
MRGGIAGSQRIDGLFAGSIRKWLNINGAGLFHRMARQRLFGCFDVPGTERQFGKQILIIDDDVSIRHMLGRVLIGEGYGVVAAANGEAGVEIVESSEVDLVLLDLKMPGMSGQETLKVLKAERPGLPVIVISAFSRQQFEGMAEVSAVLQKPLDFPILLDTIKRSLAHPVTPS